MDISDNADFFHINTGDFVIIKYSQDYFPGSYYYIACVIDLKQFFLILGKVEYVDDEGAEVLAMRKAGNVWKWPDPEDRLYYFREDILAKIAAPKPKNNRGLCSVPEIDAFL